MSVRLRNLTTQLQTITFVRPFQTYTRDVFSLQYLNITDDEYADINPALVVGVWEINLSPEDQVPPPPPPPPDGSILNGVNVGTGTGRVFKQRTSNVMEYRRLAAGTGVTISENQDDIVIEATGGGGPADTDGLAEGSTNLYFTDTRAKTAAVADAIVDGVTDVAPSQNATFDALALKSDVGHSHASVVTQTITDGVTTTAPSEDAVFDALAFKANAAAVVSSVAKSGDPALTGAVTLSAGANVTLTQVGQDIEVAATGGGGTSIGGAVTGGTSGSILYADSSSNLAQDNANLFWDATNKRIGLGTTAPTAPVSIEVIGGGESLNATCYGSSTSNVVFRRARGTSGSPTALLTNDQIVNIVAQGHDGTSFGGNNIAINLNAAENWTPSAHGTYILFKTTPNGSTGNQNRFIINHDGKVGIGPAATPLAMLHIQGIAGTDGIMFPDGTLQTTAGGGGGWAGTATSDLNMQTFAITSGTSNQRLLLKPNGTGALVAEGTGSTVGNARGTNAVDLQLTKSSATQVAQGISSTIGGGANNTAVASFSTVAGGSDNTAGVGAGPGNAAFVGGGQFNEALSLRSLIGGGAGNTIGPDTGSEEGQYGVIVGGQDNIVGNGKWTFVGGGFSNQGGLTGSYTVIGGGQANRTGNNHSVVCGGNNNYAANARGFIGGGEDNLIDGVVGVIVGGTDNTITGPDPQFCTIVGGQDHTASSRRSFIGGGQRNNTADLTGFNEYATIGGGYENTTAGDRATIPGGKHNSAIGSNSIAWGFQCSALASAATAGGNQCHAIGSNATVFGSNSVALGVNSFSAGARNYSFNQASATIGQGNAAAHNGAIALGRDARSSADGDLVLASSAGFNTPNPHAVGFRVAGDTSSLHVGKTTDQPLADVSQAVTITIASPAVFTCASAPANNTVVYFTNSGGNLPNGVAQAATINIATSTFTAGASNIADGSKVTFATTDRLPGGIGVGVDYYVVGSSGLNFQVALTQGGTAVTLAGIQAGNHTVTVPAIGSGTNSRYFVRNATATTFEISFFHGGTSLTSYGSQAGTHTLVAPTYNNISSQNRLHLYTTNAGFQSQSVSLRAPTNLTTAYNLTLPDSAGSVGAVLETDGVGNLSWTSLIHSHTLQDIYDTNFAVAGTTSLDIAYSGGGDAMLLVHSGTSGSALYIGLEAGTNDSGILINQDSASTAYPFVVNLDGAAGGAILVNHSNAANTESTAVLSNNGGGSCLELNGSSTVARILMQGSGGGGNLGITVPVSVAPHTLTLPGALGAAGSVLTDALGDGVLSWAAGGGGGTLQDAYEGGDTIVTSAAQGNGITISIDAGDPYSGPLLKIDGNNHSGDADVMAIERNSASDSFTLAVYNYNAANTGAGIYTYFEGSPTDPMRGGNVIEIAGGSADGVQIHLNAGTTGRNLLMGYDLDVIGLSVPKTGFTSYDMVLPDAQGAAGTSLENTDGAGTLGWVAKLNAPLTADVTVTSAELLAISGTPKVLLAAPAAGLAHIIERIEAFLDFNSIAYVAANDLDVKYVVSNETITTLSQGIVDSGSDTRLMAVPGGHFFSTADAVILTSATDPTLGNSDIKLRITYRTITALT